MDEDRQRRETELRALYAARVKEYFREETQRVHDDYEERVKRVLATITSEMDPETGQRFEAWVVDQLNQKLARIRAAADAEIEEAFGLRVDPDAH